MILHKGEGKDKISDLTTKLILPYLFKYTEKFATSNIDNSMLLEFFVDGDGFNYETMVFNSGKYKLPYILDNKNNKEFVLLVPKDIVRSGDQTINREDFFNSMDCFLNEIGNSELRNRVNNLINEQLRKLNNKRKSFNKLKREAQEEALKQYPQLIDYYIAYREKNTPEIDELCKWILEIPKKAETICNLLSNRPEILSENSYTEAIKRIEFLGIALKIEVYINHFCLKMVVWCQKNIFKIYLI